MIPAMPFEGNKDKTKHRQSDPSPQTLREDPGGTQQESDSLQPGSKCPSLRTESAHTFTWKILVFSIVRKRSEF